MFDNVYAQKRRNETHLNRARLTDRLSAGLKVQTAAQRELTRADAFTLIRLGHEIQWEALEFSEEHLCLSDLNQFKGRGNSAD